MKQLEEKNFAMKYIEYDVGKNVKTMEWYKHDFSMLSF